MCREYLYISKVAFFLSLLIFSHAQAELILPTPPRESAKIDNNLCGPLAKHLTQLLGEKATYQHPDN